MAKPAEKLGGTNGHMGSFTSNFLYSRRSYIGTIDVIYLHSTERFPRQLYWK